ncbi:hypothetical protein [Sphingopyxis sp. H081]|uniref:hypothetical protein n=1 Tax=Sphingopyxis sp. H081 TaxID=1759080 RepID=UPI000A70261A|nr:hypothetical protein [Sphingopyxis sp. H081]
MDITDDTLKDMSAYFNDNITSTGNINSVPLTSNSVVVVNQVSGSGIPPQIIPDVANQRLVVSGGGGGAFRMAARVLEV